MQKHGGWARGCRDDFARAVLRVAAAGRGNAATVGIAIAPSIVPSSRQSGTRAGIMCNVQLSAVMRRAMVCIVLCAAIVIMAKVRVSDSDECACAALSMCALAAGDERGAPASSEAQAAIARVSIPFALVNGLFNESYLRVACWPMESCWRSMYCGARSSPAIDRESSENTSL